VVDRSALGSRPDVCLHPAPLIRNGRRVDLGAVLRSDCSAHSVYIAAHVIWLADRPHLGHLGRQRSHAAGRRFLHRRLSLSQTSACKGRYVIDGSPRHAALVRAWQSFLCPGLARQGAVKAGRRAVLTSSPAPRCALTASRIGGRPFRRRLDPRTGWLNIEGGSSTTPSKGS
jgi:hypothetical protein